MITGTHSLTHSYSFTAPSSTTHQHSPIQPKATDNQPSQTTRNDDAAKADDATVRFNYNRPQADDNTDKTKEQNAAEQPLTGYGLTEAELKQTKELKARDREVRAHEAAHLAVAGSLAIGGATYTYQRGPDGVQYAVGGQVNIDSSPVPGDPEATLQKAQRVRAAALAPAEPSSQDLRVAAKAAQMAVQARAELAAENSHLNTTEKVSDKKDTPYTSGDDNTEKTSDKKGASYTNDDNSTEKAIDRSSIPDNLVA